MFVVTGGNGFIGSSLVKKINKEEASSTIICVDSVTPQERQEPLREVSYTKFVKSEALLEFLKGNEKAIECIFHMGACTDTTEQNKEFLYKNNTLYTKNLYLWCDEHQIPFIYASSAAIYGDGKKGFDDNHSPTNYVALNPYGQSKLDFDEWVLSRNHPPLLEKRWYGLRFFNVFGYSESHKGNMASLVYQAFHQVSETGRLKLFRSYNPKYEDGRQMRDFVYIEDIAHWIWEIYKQPNIQSGVYNMGFGRARTWLDLADAVFTAIDKKRIIEWIEIPANIREQYQYFTEAEMKKAQDQGLSQAKWSLERGVNDYIRNYLSKGT